jgi:hypothetical protein
MSFSNLGDLGDPANFIAFLARSLCLQEESRAMGWSLAVRSADLELGRRGLAQHPESHIVVFSQ